MKDMARLPAQHSLQRDVRSGKRIEDA